METPYDGLSQPPPVQGSYCAYEDSITCEIKYADWTTVSVTTKVLWADYWQEMLSRDNFLRLIRRRTVTGALRSKGRSLQSMRLWDLVALAICAMLISIGLLRRRDGMFHVRRAPRETNVYPYRMCYSVRRCCTADGCLRHPTNDCWTHCGWSWKWNEYCYYPWVINNFHLEDCNMLM
jgi:hypothetical protein